MAKYKAVKVNGVKHDYHRLVMEEVLGRKLRSDEIVHHINGDSFDNRIDNLQVVTRSEHAKMHSKAPYFPEWVYKELSEKMTGRAAANRKLSREDVAYIKEHYSPRDEEFGARALGRKYGISHQAILRIVSGECYRDFD